MTVFVSLDSPVCKSNNGISGSDLVLFPSPPARPKFELNVVTLMYIPQQPKVKYTGRD